MRIVQVIRDCFDTMTDLAEFINEPRSEANILVDNISSPFMILNRPIDMPFNFLANNIEEVYDILLIYGVVSINTEYETDQDTHDFEIDAMIRQAKIMVLNLSKHPEVKSVSITSPIRDYINGFDCGASGVFQNLRITLLPSSPDVCATYPPLTALGDDGPIDVQAPVIVIGP